MKSEPLEADRQHDGEGRGEQEVGDDADIEIVNAGGGEQDPEPGGEEAVGHIDLQTVGPAEPEEGVVRPTRRREQPPKEEAGRQGGNGEKGVA